MLQRQKCGLRHQVIMLFLTVTWRAVSATFFLFQTTANSLWAFFFFSAPELPLCFPYPAKDAAYPLKWHQSHPPQLRSEKTAQLCMFIKCLSRTFKGREWWGNLKGHIPVLGPSEACHWPCSMPPQLVPPNSTCSSWLLSFFSMSFYFKFQKGYSDLDSGLKARSL